MIRALAERRLVNLHDVFFDRGDQAIPARLIGVFDDIAAALSKSGDACRELIGEMLSASGYGVQRGFNLHDLRRACRRWRRPRPGQHPTRSGKRSRIIVGALSGGIVNWTVDRTYSLETNLHNLGVALAQLLRGDQRSPERRNLAFEHCSSSRLSLCAAVTHSSSDRLPAECSIGR